MICVRVTYFNGTKAVLNADHIVCIIPDKSDQHCCITMDIPIEYVDGMPQYHHDVQETMDQVLRQIPLV